MTDLKGLSKADVKSHDAKMPDFFSFIYSISLLIHLSGPDFLFYANCLSPMLSSIVSIFMWQKHPSAIL